MYCVWIHFCISGIRASHFLSRRTNLAEIRNVSSRVSVQAIIPPSTLRFAPVMYEDSGPATKRYQRGDLINVSIAAERCEGLLWYRPLACGGIRIRIDRTRLHVVLTVMPRLATSLDKPLSETS